MENIMADNSIIFTDEAGNEEEFFVLEQTTLGGINYLLVADTMDEDADDGTFLILRENVSGSEDEVAAFDIVEDKEELKSVAQIFSELLEDVDLEVE
jgi:uncharacterized protein YrzB (UPF0473 family)